VHGRPPAFAGRDGASYTAATYVDDLPAADGRYGAALLFVRWSAHGDRPEGHLETPYLAHGTTAADAVQPLLALSLHEVKAHLDRLCAARDAGLERST